MKVATFQMSDDIKIFCPFCGKLAFDAQAEELSEAGRTQIEHSISAEVATTN